MNQAEQPPPSGLGRVGNWIWTGLGWMFVGIGLIGAFLPILPTVPFLLLALACFGRGSPRLEAWLLAHPRMGPPLRLWRERGAIPRRAKVLAITMMSLSLGSLVLFSSMPWPGKVVVVIVWGLVSRVILRAPDR